jgi:hypothetical protein
MYISWSATELALDYFEICLRWGAVAHCFPASVIEAIILVYQG